jgi:xylulokinase
LKPGSVAGLVDFQGSCRYRRLNPSGKNVAVRRTLGLDVGTTALKAVLVDERGAIIAQACRSYPTSEPAPGWTEQDPLHWWQAAADVTRSLLAGHGGVEAVGLSGQMHGAVALDDEGRVLHPAILWNDQRSGAECRELDELTGGRVASWTLNPPRTAFTATKLLWLRRHRPEVYARIAAVLLPKDYVRYRLSGLRATDVTDASGTAMLAVRERRWSKDVLDALAIPQAWLPQARESVEVAGSVDAAGAAASGLRAGTPIVSGAADQAAAAIGNGVVRAGVLSITLGTSGVVYAQIDRVLVDPSGALHTFCHAIPGTWQLMAGVLSAGGSLRWFRDAIWAPSGGAAGDDAYAAICRGIGEIRPGGDGLVFLPYLTGERSPHADPDARGCWLGLTTRHDHRHLARAILEGVAFALRSLVEIAEGLGVRVDEIRVAGGGARSLLWLQILADVLGRPVRPALNADASACGAAALAMAAASGRDLAALAADWAKAGPLVEPIAAHAAVYERLYGVFNRLYAAVSPAMHELTALERDVLPDPARIAGA